MKRGPTPDSSPPPPAPDRRAVELVLLLAHLARCDGEVAEVEIEAIEHIGKMQGVSATWLTALRGMLERGEPLPPPDHALLRETPLETLAAARLVVAADGVLHEAEMALLEKLHGWLDKDPVLEATGG